MDITKRIKLDFMCPPYPIVVYAKQGDANSRYVEIEPYAYGEPYIIPDGVTAKFACKKPDGKRIVNDYPTISENIITVPLTEQTLAISGNAQAAIVLLDAEGKILTTQNFTLSIEASPYINSEIESVDEYYVVSFPAPTASDNNKILTVSDGKYIYDYIENIQSNSDYTVSSAMILDVPTMAQNATDFTEAQKADVLEFAEAAKKAAGNTTILLRYSGATSPATFYYANGTYVFRAINPLCNPGDGESVEMIVVELNTQRNTLLAYVHAHLGDTGEWLLEKDDDSKYVNDLSVLTTETAASLATNSLVGYAIERGLENVNSEVDALKQQIVDLSGVNSEIELLKQQIADLSYEAIVVSSFTHNAGTVEKGNTVTSVKFTWKTNKTPTALTLDDETVDVSSTSKTLSGLSLTTDKTWTLKATDERGATSTKTTAIKFYNGVYYGAATEPTTYDSDFILALPTKTLSASKVSSFNVTTGMGEYIYYCLPVSMGTCLFNVGGFDGGINLVATIDFTNSHNHTESYYIYRSDNANLGTKTVKVS